MSYKFNISLSILNHLGRNLYRNFITVIGEAISNSWDADAENVWIEINRESRHMFIVDDGTGMTSEEFQNKFLKIGYSKRKNNENVSAKKRPFIGRKGIGKLALLSCAKKVHIASKSKGCDIVGGLIDNSGLDKAILDDVSSQDYPLEKYDKLVAEKLNDLSEGTAIYFEEINDGIVNTLEYLKKAIALYFRFSLIDSSFNIFLNGKLEENKISIEALSDLASSTQFVWQVNSVDDPYLKSKISPAVNTTVKSYKALGSSLRMCGFIATTRKPSDLKIRGTNEKVSVDLFVNGRLREKDLLKHIPTARIVESYLYGQIHYDALDKEKDVFTSSREGIVSDDPMFCEFLQEFEVIIRRIIDDWDILREKEGNDGDPDNSRLSPKTRKAQELFSATINDMIPINAIPPEGIVETWVGQLREEAQFNIPSYTECFIAENLLREHIRHNKLSLTSEAQSEADKWKKREQEAKGRANLSIDIRQIIEDLQYLSMDDLSNLVDKPQDPNKDIGISRDSKIYKPLRDAVCHTSLITQVGKEYLSVIFKNIQSRLQQLLDNNNPKK